MKKLQLNQKNLRDIANKYRDDPIGYVEDMLCFHKLSTWQRELLLAIRDKNVDRIAIASSTGSGKTSLLCCAALWSITCFHDSTVVATSSTKLQLAVSFVKTMRQIVSGSRLSEWYEVLGETARLKTVEANLISFRAWSIDNPVAFQGIHAKHLLFIADEASAIPQCIFDAMAGNLQTEGSLEVLSSNPTSRVGTLADCFNEGESSSLKLMHISAKDCPHVPASWIQKMANRYGEGTDQYNIRVLGLFPTEDLDTFIIESRTKGACARQNNLNTFAPRIAALDVAGGGVDSSFLAIRQGLVLPEIKNYDTDDPNVLQEMVERDMTLLNIDCIAVDFNGIGWSVYKYLLKKFPGRVFGVKLSQLSYTKDKEYWNLRAKWWGLANDWLLYGSVAPTKYEKEFIAQSIVFLLDHDDKGRMILESKAKAKVRNSKFKSPDIFDAFAYTFSISDRQAESVMDERRAERLEELKPVGSVTTEQQNVNHFLENVC